MLYIYIMFFTEIEMDFANYTDDTTPHTCSHQIEKVIKLLEKKNAENLFQWFCVVLKANPAGKCHFVTNNSEKMAINIRSEKILSSSNQKY